jgi:4-hydroxy-tetrahydrodipicolinate synthase
MASTPDYLPAGVIPATLLAFNDDFSVNESETRRHLRHVAAVHGVTAITVNGHASEVHACTIDEQRRLLAIAREEVQGRLPIVSGVYADGSIEAARIARLAEEDGASALLVFPPNTLSMGGHLRPEMAEAHFSRIADATSLPLIAFQYPAASGLGYPFETLLRLVERVPSIRAVKDWSADPMLHERQIRVLQSLDRPVNVLTTHSSWLLASLTMGARGVLSGAGSVVADLQVALFHAVQAGDLRCAQAINDRLYPLQQAFYAPPFVEMHNRMKECLVMLGRQERAVVRPPLVKLPERELRQLRDALRLAGLQPDTPSPK